MKVLVVEPFFTGSHAAWVNGLVAHSAHRVATLSLPGRHWKWRMHGGAVTLAERFMTDSDAAPDLLLFSDMIDVTTFLALTRSKSAGIPTAIYFHENQLSYPWSPADSDPAAGRDGHYGFINFASALACDAVFFNSAYHQESFFEALQIFLRGFPDFRPSEALERLRCKSRVLYLGLDLAGLDARRPPRPRQAPPLVLWNHRWEYDKNPEAFFRLLDQLVAADVDFEVAVLGQHFQRWPPVFEAARARLGARICHYGYAPSRADYADWLWRATLLPVTSNQEFFGASVIEATYCETIPLLPKRLTYPELFPAFREQIFYHDHADFLAKAIAILTAPDRVPCATIRRDVSRFDWAQCIASYDRAFEALV